MNTDISLHLQNSDTREALERDIALYSVKEDGSTKRLGIGQLDCNDKVLFKSVCFDEAGQNFKAVLYDASGGQNKSMNFSSNSFARTTGSDGIEKVEVYLKVDEDLTLARLMSEAMSNNYWFL